MYELSKSVQRRMHEPGFVANYFVGSGIDIGCGEDALDQYGPQFPLMTALKRWDIQDGDAQYMEGVPDNEYDFVHSAHCLEHVYNPVIALDNWIRICKPGGHLVVLIPDEDLYEQGVWPPNFNTDHKWAFTLFKVESWCPKSMNVLTLLCRPDIEVLSVKQLHQTFRHYPERFDQTMTPLGECAIEFVVRKRECQQQR